MILSILTTIALLGAAGDGATYIRAGNVFDGERFIGSRVIVVAEGRIEAVEDSGFVVSAGAHVLEALDATVIPGLIDGHIRFMAPPMPYTDNIERHGWGKGAAEEVSAFPDNRRHLLMNGVTGIIDMGAPPATYRGLRRSLDKGSIVGPELYFSGPLITAPAGHPAGTTYIGQHDLIDCGTFQVTDTIAVREKVAVWAKDGVDFVEIVYDAEAWGSRAGSGGNHKLSEKGDSPSEQLIEFAAVQSPFSPGRKVPGLRLEVAQVAIDEAHRHGLKVFAHVGSEEEASDMVRAGADGIEHGFATASDSLLSEMAARGIFFTPTICACVHSAPVGAPSVKQTLRRAWELGVPLVVGTDFPVSNGDNCGDDIFREMRLFEDGGIPRLTVLKAATAEPARKLGEARELGRVASGYRANLVFIRGSADTGALGADRVERVMLQGETVVQDGRICANCAGGLREQSASFLGYPYWDPLLSWLAGASATDFDLFRTGITAEADVLYSIRNMWFANTVLDLPSPIPRTALRAGMHFDNQNRLFYGLGNDTRLDDTTEYSNLIFREWVSGRTHISGPWKALSSVVLDQSTLSPYHDNALPVTLAGNSGGDEVAVSLTLAHDTRDHQTNPWYGHYISVGAQAAPALLPHGHSFQKVTFDARGFVSPAHRHIVAGRLLCQKAFGDAPFYYLPEFGGDTLGRGYMPFRFRDRASVIGQLEYRFPIWSFISGAAFVDIGQFQPAIGRFSLDGFHPSVGFGPRFSFGPNESSMIGIDVGFTPEGWNLVLHNGQVF